MGCVGRRGGIYSQELSSRSGDLCSQRAKLRAQSCREPGRGLLGRTKPEALGSPSQQARPTPRCPGHAALGSVVAGA